jgi:hypothetical protein
MPVYTSHDEEYPVPYGYPSTGSCYVNGIEYFFSSLKVVNKLNQPSSFEVNLMDVTSSDTNIAYGMPIMFFVGNKLFLKGRMDRPKFMTDGYANIKGLGMEASLKDKIVSALTSATAYGTNRFQYTNANSDLIVKELCSLNGDGVTPWVVTPLTNEDFGDISMRFENVDKMNALATLSDSCTNSVGSSFDWWISQDVNEAPSAYATDYFNISSRRGVSSPTYTFYVSGDDQQNAVSTDREIDYEATATYVNVNGYGDGINQLRTSCFNNTGDGVSTPRYTLTTQAITATYTGNVTVADSSKLTAGTAIMGEERVTFTVVNGTTINISARGAGSTTATTHPHGIYIANWIDPAESNIANWEVGSAMKTQDRKEISLDATNIIDLDTLQLIATRTLLDRMNVPERITLNPEDPFDATTNMNLGDAVTIVDADTGLNGTYRIVSEELDVDGDGNLTVTYEVSNRHLYLLESMNQIKATGQNEAVASQGATNIDSVHETDNMENESSPTSNPAPGALDIYFSIPGDVKAINKVLLSYKLEKPKVWSKTAETTTTTASNEPESLSVWYDVGTEIDTSGSNQFITLNAVPGALGTIPNGWTVSMQIFNKTGGAEVYYMKLLNLTQSTTLFTQENDQFSIGDNSQVTWKRYFSTTEIATSDQIQLKIYSGTIGTDAAKTTFGGFGFWLIPTVPQAHTHTVDYDLDTRTYGTTDIRIFTTDDASSAPTWTERTSAIETVLGRALNSSENSTENDIDVTQYFMSTGWKGVRIVSNGNCRCKTQITTKVFIQSR